MRKKFWLLAVLGLIVLIRLPSFFEPYWDGDEGVYYILGQMIQRGAVLYRDIWDNKTPLLYLLYALSPTLLWVKLSATICVLGTSFGAYELTKRIIPDKKTVWSLLAAFLTGGILSLPALAGNTANAELYFTLPIVWGALVVYDKFLSVPFRRSGTNYYLIALGLLAALAFNLKVPAIFDFLGLFVAITIWRFIRLGNFSVKKLPGYLLNEIKFYLPIAIAFFVPFLIFVYYFYSHHALTDFFVAAFAQNSTYVSVYSGALGKLGSPLILHAIVLLLAVGILAVALARKLVTKEFFFLAIWLGFSIYAALLSGRPYPHYFLQNIAPLMLIFIYCLANFRKYWWGLLVLFVTVWSVFRLFGSPDITSANWGYYGNFFDYISERKAFDQYVSYFGQDNLDAYQMAEFLKERTRPNDPVFVWGENDYIYVLSHRPPVTKFIRAHHLTTVDSKNYDLIMQRLWKYQPKYIFIARPVQFTFPALEEFVHKNYRLATSFGSFYVYQNVLPANPPLWNPFYN